MPGSKTPEGQTTALAMGLLASETVSGIEAGYVPVTVNAEGALRVNGLSASPLPRFASSFPALNPAHPAYTDFGPVSIPFPLKGIRFKYTLQGIEFPVLDTVTIFSGGFTVAQWSGAGIVAGDSELIYLYPGIDLSSVPAPDARVFSIPIVYDFSLRFSWGAGAFVNATIDLGGDLIP